MTKFNYQPSIMSKISHEICIPLTGIMGMLHFLHETPLTAQQKEYLEIIQDSAKRLLSLETILSTYLIEKKLDS